MMNTLSATISSSLAGGATQTAETPRGGNAAVSDADLASFGALMARVMTFDDQAAEGPAGQSQDKVDPETVAQMLGEFRAESRETLEAAFPDGVVTEGETLEDWANERLAKLDAMMEEIGATPEDVARLLAMPKARPEGVTDAAGPGQRADILQQAAAKLSIEAEVSDETRVEAEDSAPARAVAAAPLAGAPAAGPAALPHRADGAPAGVTPEVTEAGRAQAARTPQAQPQEGQTRDAVRPELPVAKASEAPKAQEATGAAGPAAEATATPREGGSAAPVADAYGTPGANTPATTADGSAGQRAQASVPPTAEQITQIAAAEIPAEANPDASEADGAVEAGRAAASDTKLAVLAEGRVAPARALSGTTQTPADGSLPEAAARALLIQAVAAPADKALPPEIQAMLTPQATPTAIGALAAPAPAQQSQTPAQAQANGFARNLGGQIRGVSFTEGTTRIELTPQGLGKMEIEIAPDDNGKLRVVVRAENAAVLNALRSDRDMLAGLIRDGGASVEDGAMSFEGFDQRGGTQARTEDHGAHLHDTRLSDDDDEEATAVAQMAEDGRLNILT